ncbi:MAG TPA: carboxypeptidase regulatory-like domain-containing protein [Acidobacteriaceae bacterium]|nr:carboxypeptidase regulatory-like domain-containing protein [Acidobacteriaceae bacterium]
MPRIQQLLRSFVLASLCSALPALAATPITGVVTNKTTGKPSAGDTVTLIRLAQGMQEATHTTTDAHGRYTLEVPDNGLHLVRVTHDLANYFRAAQAGTTTVDVDVYSAAAKVKGVTSEAEVMRIESDASGTALHVVQNFFLKNDSNPPMTQFSKQPFDFWLPDGAVVEGAAAESPDGMPVRQAPVPLAEKNHFTFLFPIRPGETRFQITYRIPYTGKLALEPKLTMPTDTVAIMIPKSMTFAPVAGAPYSPVDDEVNAHTLVARSVAPSAPLGFTLTGTGQLPRDANAPTQGGDQSAQGAPQAQDNSQPATADTRPGGGLGNPLDEGGNRDPWAKYKWWILSGIAVLLAAAAGVLLRKPAAPSAVATGSHAAGPLPLSPQGMQTHSTQLLQALKEEMFALETDHLQQRISDEDYVANKAALELVLRRALQRGNATERELISR